MAFSGRAREERASKLANLQPIKGRSFSASWEPSDGESHYVVRSYATPIARVRRGESGDLTKHLSYQQFSNTTSHHQGFAASNLPGREAEPLGYQDWYRQGSPARQSPSQSLHQRAFDQSARTHIFSDRRSDGPDSYSWSPGGETTGPLTHSDYSAYRRHFGLEDE